MAGPSAFSETPSDSSHPSPATLLPHAGPAVLIDSIVEWTPTRLVAGVLLREDHPYGTIVAGARVISALTSIEMFAQAAALHAALSQRHTPPSETTGAQSSSPQTPGRPRAGRLVAVPRLQCEVDTLPWGRKLLISVEPETPFGRLVRVGATLNDGARTLVDGLVTVAFTDDRDDDSVVKS